MYHIFKDTKALANVQITFAQWGEICRKIREDEYDYIVPLSYQKFMNDDDMVFINIRLSHLHTIIARTRIIPCSKSIEWVIKHINFDIEF